jgi:hypothetical protein
MAGVRVGSRSMLAAPRALRFDREHGVRRNHAWDALLSIRQVRRYPETAGATDPHPLDSIEQSSDETHAVDAHIDDHHGAVLFEAGVLGESPRPIPSDGLTSAGRHAEPDLIVAASLHCRPLAEGLAQQLDSRLDPSAADQADSRLLTAYR